MSKPSRQAIEKAKKNFISGLQDISSWLQNECARLKKEEFEDGYDFLFRKAGILADLCTMFPFAPGHCPFCIENNMGYGIVNMCVWCSYAATHGECGDRESIYRVLILTNKLFRQTMVALYATEKPKKEDITRIVHLVEKLRDLLDYWKYHDILAKKGKDWREFLLQKIRSRK